MKCPKCGFVSFDHNEACPKCGNDLSRERELMNFPPYRPTPLSLLGVLAGGGDVDTVGVSGKSEASTAAGAAAEELLISLDTLSDEDQEPIQFITEASGAGPEAQMETRMESLDEELTISLDDLSDEGPDLVLSDAEPEAETAEPEVLDEIVFEPETASDEGPLQEGFWEGEAPEQKAGERPLDDASPVEEAFSDEDTSGVEQKKTEPDLFELELEPLELDLEIDEPDKKMS